MWRRRCSSRPQNGRRVGRRRGLRSVRLASNLATSKARLKRSGRRSKPTTPMRLAPRRGWRYSAARGSLSALPEAYVARLFDDYAPRFDAHLTKALDYRAPALIAEALDLAAPGRRFASALDIGCGTGLMGEAVRDRVDRLVGVDLSPGMIARARERGLYDELEVAEAAAFLARTAPGAYDCILAADALCYFGELRADRPGLQAGARSGRRLCLFDRELRGRRFPPARNAALRSRARLCRGDGAGGRISSASHARGFHSAGGRRRRPGAGRDLPGRMSAVRRIAWRHGLLDHG